MERRKVIIEQAEQATCCAVDRFAGAQHRECTLPNVRRRGHRGAALVSMVQDNVGALRDYGSLAELPHDPEQIEQVLLNIVRNACRRWSRKATGILHLVPRTS